MVVFEIWFGLVMGKLGQFVTKLSAHNMIMAGIIVSLPYCIFIYMYMLVNICAGLSGSVGCMSDW